MKKTLLVSLLTLPLAAQSQSIDSSLIPHTSSLPEITVRDFRFDRAGFSVWASDTARQAGNAAQILFSENILSIRTNAPGTLASGSARGVGGNRTAVIWNGLPLQSPMNGFSDLALLPVWAGDQVAVQLGGQSAALGSGAMGGAVLLNSNSTSYRRGGFASVGLVAGSFSEKQADAEAGFSAQNWTATLRGQFVATKNDFPFRNTTLLGAPRVRQTNNQIQRTDVQQLNRVALGKNTLLETAAWWQEADRAIPPSMTEGTSTARQWDKSLRVAANLRTAIGSKSVLATRLGWLDESIFFRLADDVDTSRSRTLLAGTDFSSEIFRKTAVRAGVSARFDAARSDGYSDSTAIFRQTRPLAYLSASQPFGLGRVTALARQEFADGKRQPLTWSLAADFFPERPFAGRLHLSKNFNIPTFNDRVWLNYGNSNLRPESGHGGDIGLIFKHKRTTSLEMQATAFSILVDDWIQWLPGTDGVFRPGNLRRVWSRGTEASISATRFFGKIRLTGTARHQLTRATNVRVYAENDPSLGRQLVYVPRHTGCFSVKMERGRGGMVYQHNLTGRRFSQPDNGAAVAGFLVGNLSAWWRISLKMCALQLHGALENVWDSPYQIIAFRPMPGRSWRAGVRVQILD